MKKFLKKHFNKFFIGILTLISAIAIGIGISSTYNKSYAYQTDEFTYSIDYIGINPLEQNIQGMLYDDNKKCYTYDLGLSNSYCTIFGKTLNTQQLYNCYILINFSPYYSSDNINYTFYENYSYAQSLTFNPRYENGYVKNNETYPNNQLYNTKTKLNNGVYDYFTYIHKLSMNNNYNSTDTFDYFSINFTYLQPQNYYFKLYIRNIDIVPTADIGLSQYYENYYGAIEDNYNNLLSDYNDLQTNYNTLNDNYTSLQDNYNTLLSVKNQLQQDINDLQTNYNTLQNTYNTLQNTYNTLNDNYTSLQTTYDNLQSDYNTLQSNYNTMLNNYNQISANYEALQNLNVPFNPLFINAYTITLNDNILNDVPLNSFIDYNYNSIIINYNDINLQDNQYSTNSNNIITITIHYKDSAYIDNLKGYIYSRHSLNDYTDISFIYNNNVVYQESNMNNEHTDNNGDIAQYELLIGQTFDTMVISYRCDDFALYDNQSSKLYTFGTYYEGYKEGINANNIYYTNLVNEYTTTINNLSNSNRDLKAVNEQLRSNISYYENQINGYLAQIDNLNNTITSKQLTINSLNEQIGSFSSDYGINNMLWTIASTPFESFKNIWNVDFFGVNISNLVTGFLTGLIVIWVIKKLFL